jgi:hypothetical protein
MPTLFAGMSQKAESRVIALAIVVISGSSKKILTPF